jgi:hypothetical protein
VSLSKSPICSTNDQAQGSSLSVSARSRRGPGLPREGVQRHRRSADQAQLHAAPCAWTTHSLRHLLSRAANVLICRIECTSVMSGLGGAPAALPGVDAGRCRRRTGRGSGRCGGTAGPRSGRPGRGGVGPFAWVPADLGYGGREARRSSIWASFAQRSRGATTFGRMAARSTAFGPCRQRKRTSRSAAASVGRSDILPGLRRVPPYVAHRRFARRLSVPSGRQRQRQGDFTPCHF